MKTTATETALVNLQRNTGLVIEPRHENDARQVLGALYDAAHAAGVQSVPVPGTEDGKLSAEELGALRLVLRGVLANAPAHAETPADAPAPAPAKTTRRRSRK